MSQLILANIHRTRLTTADEKGNNNTFFMFAFTIGSLLRIKIPTSILNNERNILLATGEPLYNSQHCCHNHRGRQQSQRERILEQLFHSFPDRVRAGTGGGKLELKQIRLHIRVVCVKNRVQLRLVGRFW